MSERSVIFFTDGLDVHALESFGTMESRGPMESEALASRLAVQDVIVRYAACLDERDFDLYRECFTRDVELHGFGDETILGVDAWIAFVHRALEPFTGTQHMLGPPLVELGDGTASLRADLQAQHFLREPRGRIFTLWGFYLSSLVNRDGTWRIQRHELVTHATRTHDRFRDP